MLYCNLLIKEYCYSCLFLRQIKIIQFNSAVLYVVIYVDFFVFVSIIMTCYGAFEKYVIGIVPGAATASVLSLLQLVYKTKFMKLYLKTLIKMISSFRLVLEFLTNLDMFYNYSNRHFDTLLLLHYFEKFLRCAARDLLIFLYLCQLPGIVNEFLNFFY